jgi:hypothetical protein
MDSFISTAKYSYDLKTLVIFRSLLKDKVIGKFVTLLESIEKHEDTSVQLESYSNFVSELYKHSVNFTDYVLNKILEDENVYVHSKCMDDTPKVLDECINHELDVLNSVARVQSSEITSQIDYSKYLPTWETTSYNFKDEYFLRINNISSYGYGMFAQYHMFIVENSEIPLG